VLEVALLRRLELAVHDQRVRTELLVGMLQLLDLALADVRPGRGMRAVLHDGADRLHTGCAGELAGLGELVPVVYSGSQHRKGQPAFEVGGLLETTHTKIMPGIPQNPHVDSLAARTLELVDIPSVSRDESRIADHVRRLMPGAPDYDDDTVLFYSGRVVLAGHFDTVPAQENIPGRIEDGWVIGLGATDMKGGVAVMIELARAAASFGYLFFGREELPAGESALPRFFERFGLDADLVVMLEPTDNAIQAGCLGNLNARLVFHGVSAHSARPWLGDNAIDHAVKGLATITAFEPLDVEIGGLVFREVLSITGIEGG